MRVFRGEQVPYSESEWEKEVAEESIVESKWSDASVFFAYGIGILSSILLIVAIFYLMCTRRPRKSAEFNHHNKHLPSRKHHLKSSAAGRPVYYKKSASPATSPAGNVSATSTPSPTNNLYQKYSSKDSPTSEDTTSGPSVTEDIKNEKKEEPGNGIAKNEKINVISNSGEILSGNLGQLFFSVKCEPDQKVLTVSILKGQNLPVKDPGTPLDYYVKLQLLPGKKQRVKTRVLRKTRNPLYDEHFSFYEVLEEQLQGITLHFAVLTFDRYSRDDVVGEILFPLSGVDFKTDGVADVIYQRDIMPRASKLKSQGRGELLVSLCYQPAANRLTVVILKARNIPKMDCTGLADPFVKIYLMYKGQRIAKRKTHVKKHTLNPVFNESFVFDMPNGSDGLQNISLEFVCLDYDRVTKNEVIGFLEMGVNANSESSAEHHWMEVRNAPRRQIADWHKLYLKNN